MKAGRTESVSQINACSGGPKTLSRLVMENLSIRESQMDTKKPSKMNVFRLVKNADLPRPNWLLSKLLYPVHILIQQ